MPRRSAAKAACPRPEHAGSRVHRDGTYGVAGHRRQRYRCFPAEGGREHVSTELLPREEAWRERCETRHGQLGADWVELFAPVVFEPHRPGAWPAAGGLVIDDLPFRVRNPR